MLLVGAAAARAQTVIGTGTNATGIEGLTVDGTLYDVTFVVDSAEAVHGTLPGRFRFDTKGEANAAVDAVLEEVKRNDGLQFDAKGKDDGSGEPPPEQEGPCESEQCATDDVIGRQCEDFVDFCLTLVEVNEEECSGGAFVIREAIQVRQLAASGVQSRCRAVR